MFNFAFSTSYVLDFVVKSGEERQRVRNLILTDLIWGR